MSLVKAEAHSHHWVPFRFPFNLIHDTKTTPQQLIEAARLADLQEIVITLHNTVYGIQETKKIGERLGVRVSAGIEVTTQPHLSVTNRFGLSYDHLTAIFPDSVDVTENMVRPLIWGNRDKVAYTLKTMGAKVIGPHLTAEGGFSSMSYPAAYKMAAAGLLDAFEGVTGQGLHPDVLLMADALQIPCVGGSDDHLGMPGIAYTLIPAGMTLYEAIERRQTIPQHIPNLPKLAGHVNALPNWAPNWANAAINQVAFALY